MTLPKEIRVGIIGCGEIAHAHARFILGEKRHKLVAVCDTKGEKRRVFAQKFGVGESYEDVGRLLDEHKLEAVHILTPPQTHAEIAIRAMEAGCNVLVEKPMALSSEEAEEMVAVAATQDVTLCVNHNQLFEPVMLKALALLRDGAIGTVVSVESHYGVNYVSEPSRPWVETLPGGIFQNLAPHPLYLVLEFLGDPVEVHTSTLGTSTLEGDTLDELHILMKGERVIGHIAISLSIRPNTNFLRISGTRASLHVDFASRTLRLERLRPLPKALSRGLMNIELAGQLSAATIANAFRLMCGQLKSYQGHENLIRAFYQSIQEGSPAPVSIESARRVVEVYDRVRKELVVT